MSVHKRRRHRDASAVGRGGGKGGGHGRRRGRHKSPREHPLRQQQRKQSTKADDLVEITTTSSGGELDQSKLRAAASRKRQHSPAPPTGGAQAVASTPGACLPTSTSPDPTRTSRCSKGQGLPDADLLHAKPSEAKLARPETPLASPPVAQHLAQSAPGRGYAEFQLPITKPVVSSIEFPVAAARQGVDKPVPGDADPTPEWVNRLDGVPSVYREFVELAQADTQSADGNDDARLPGIEALDSYESKETSGSRAAAQQPYALVFRTAHTARKNGPSDTSSALEKQHQECESGQLPSTALRRWRKALAAARVVMLLPSRRKKIQQQQEEAYREEEVRNQLEFTSA
ncbi:uncharacterized protein LOC142574330 [Dermacentor variabilis]|uniref:uncharacterized protein LOC142574330 n=1 Tax=Dermacentor variabilis TaxID=34621 RepID=UPI003F5C4C9F